MIHLHSHPHIKDYFVVYADDGKNMGIISREKDSYGFRPNREIISIPLSILQSIVAEMQEKAQ
jgi:hypothetical protein